MIVGLSLMNGLVLQDQRQPAEHHDDHRRHQRHHRQPPRQRIGHRPAPTTIATMNTAVATKMPARSPVATASGMIGASSGSNSAGRELAKKNSSSGPRSSASLSERIELVLFVGHATVSSVTALRSASSAGQLSLAHRGTTHRATPRPRSSMPNTASATPSAANTSVKTAGPAAAAASRRRPR